MQKVLEGRQWLAENSTRVRQAQFFIIATGTLPHPLSKQQESEFKSRINREYQRAIEGPELTRRIRVTTTLTPTGAFKVKLSLNHKFDEQLFGVASGAAASGGGDGGGGGGGSGGGGGGGEEVDAAMLQMSRAISNTVSALLG